ncbi:nucleotidyltransferase family protein [Nitrosococcus halophilus]|uniref:nucleotidyltransferase family protein n=1 Tax=Nitrosococcus halophilus TaxID=133539 RepID=UPI0002EAED49|nr:nucleotidyltransferase domain-containing protein [Nitrosococcus halophilus]
MGLRLVVLFGSHAKGRLEPGPDSDIDVGVYGCPSEKYWECYGVINEAFGGSELDLVRLEDADPLFEGFVFLASHTNLTKECNLLSL